MLRAIPFALSVHHFISSVGADAGFAAIIGLAILVLLLFAQARETATLRDRADQAEDELLRLQTYVEQIARRPARPAPVPPAVTPPPAAASVMSAVTSAPVAARVAAPRVAAAAGPFAPAGVGAPELGSATRAVAVVEPAVEAPFSVRSLRPAAEPDATAEDEDMRFAVAGAVAVAAAPPALAALTTSPPPDGLGGSAGSDPPAGASGPPAEIAPPPSTAAGNGLSRSAVADDLDEPSELAEPSEPFEPRAGVRGQRRAGPGDRSAGASRTGPPRFTEPPRRRAGAGAGRGRVVVVAAVVVAVVVAGLIVILSGGGTPARVAKQPSQVTTQRRGRRGARHHAHGAASQPIAPSSVAVTVLNGTTTTNLAHDVMAKLAGDGYGQASAPATASDQSHATTVVGYLPGYRQEALVVARSLGLASSVVAAVGAADRTVACGAASGACPAEVVVTVGADLSSIAGATQTG